MLSTVEKILFLKGIELFQKLSNEDLVQIAQIAEEVHFEKDEPMMVEGDVGDALFITIEGRVRISKGAKTLNELGGKEVLGEMGILDSAPRSASVTALNDVTALKLERDPFHELMSERQEIAQGIIHVLLQRLRILSAVKAGELPTAPKPAAPEPAAPEPAASAAPEPAASAAPEPAASAAPEPAVPGPSASAIQEPHASEPVESQAPVVSGVGTAGAQGDE